MLKKEWKQKGFIDETVNVPEGMNETEYLKQEIRRMCQEKGAIILAHYYTIGDIQDIADFVGDSLALARKAAETDAEEIQGRASWLSSYFVCQYHCCCKSPDRCCCYQW